MSASAAWSVSEDAWAAANATAAAMKDPAAVTSSMIPGERNMATAHLPVCNIINT